MQNLNNSKRVLRMGTKLYNALEVMKLLGICMRMMCLTQSMWKVGSGCLDRNYSLDEVDDLEDVSIF